MHTTRLQTTILVRLRPWWWTERVPHQLKREGRGACIYMEGWGPGDQRVTNMLGCFDSSTMQNTSHITECCFLRPVSHEGCIWANHNTEGPKIIYSVLSASSVFASEFLSFGRTPTAESCTHNCSPKVAETDIPCGNHSVHNITALMPNCLTFSCHPIWAHKVTNAAHTAQKRSTDPPKTAEAVLSAGRL